MNTLLTQKGIVALITGNYKFTLPYLVISLITFGITFGQQSPTIKGEYCGGFVDQNDHSIEILDYPEIEEVQYQFFVGTDTFDIINTDNPNFRLDASQIPELEYRQYTVKAKALINNAWTEYSQSCINDNSPHILSSDVNGLSNVHGQTVFEANVQDASQVKFKLWDRYSGINYTQTRNISDNPNFKTTLGELTNTNGEYPILGKNYKLYVKVLNNNIWSDYGTSCLISTTNETQLTTKDCGRILYDWDESISFLPVLNATEYSINITSNDFSDTLEISTSATSFNLSDLHDNPLTFNSELSISVSALVAGNWTIRNHVCSVFTPIRAKISPVHCGSSLNQNNDTLIVEAVNSAIQYSLKFETNSHASYFPIFTTTDGNNQIPTADLNLRANTAYDVSVSVRTQNGWSEYGPKCNINFGQEYASLTPCLLTGQTFHADNDTFNINGVAGATAYRFMFRSTDDTIIQSVFSNSEQIDVSQFNLKDGTTYRVFVKPELGGEFTTFTNPINSTCYLNTSSYSKITTEDCGSNLEYDKDTLNFEVVANASKYRVKFMEPSYPYFEKIIETENASLILQHSHLKTTTYNAIVAVETTNGWSEYGDTCQFTIKIATTGLDQSNCGQTFNIDTDSVLIREYKGAEAYRFWIKKSDGTSSYTLHTVDNNTKQALAPLNLEKGTAYNVQVSVIIGGKSDQLWDVCEIFTEPEPTINIDSYDCYRQQEFWNDTLNFESVPDAQNYRVRFEDRYDSTKVLLRETNGTTPFLAFSELDIPTKSHNVSVQYLTESGWSEYGNECPISSKSAITWLDQSKCGNTFNLSRDSIHIIAHPGAAGYMILFVEDTENGSTLEYYVNNNTSQNLSQFNLKPSTAYRVQVAVVMGGEHDIYSTQCVIQTQGKTVTLRDISCNETIGLSYNDALYLNTHSEVEVLKFRFDEVGGDNSVVEQEINNSTYARMDNFDLKPNTPYSVSINALFPGGIWSDYGTSCMITTDGGGINLHTASCGATLGGDEKNIHFQYNKTAENYEIEFTDVQTGEIKTEQFEPWTYKPLSMFDLTINSEYSVRLRAEYQPGVWGDFGDACHIYTSDGKVVLREISCDVTVGLSHDDALYINTHPHAEVLKFRFDEVGGGNSVVEQEINNSTYARMNNFDLKPNTSYSVSINARHPNNLWSGYGTPCTITTDGGGINLHSASCGATLGGDEKNIHFQYNKTADNYEIEFTHIQTGELKTQQFTPWSYKPLSMFNLDPASEYSVRLRAEYRPGVWGDFGDACTIYTSGGFVTLRDISCDVTVGLSHDDALYLNSQANAETLKFRFTEIGGNDIVEKELDSWTYVRMNNFDLKPNTSYSVSINALFPGDLWSGFGTACTITTNGGGINLHTASCGATLGGDEKNIHFQYNKTADNYEIEFTNLQSGDIKTQQFTPWSYKPLSMFNLTINSGYSVRLRAEYQPGVWGDFGDACTIYTSGGFVTLRDISCNATVGLSHDDALHLNSQANAETLKFRFTEVGGTNHVEEQEVTSSTYARMNNFDVKPNTVYSVSINARYPGNVWSGFGSSCTITTNGGGINLHDASCGATLGEDEKNIHFQHNKTADNYEIEFTNVNTGEIQIYEFTPWSYKPISLFNLEASSEFVVRLRAEYQTSVWGDFGDECTIFTAGNAAKTVDGFEEISATEVEIYPNPSFGVVTISLDGTTSVISVTDFQGRECHSETAKFTTAYQMDLSHLAKGAYTVIIRSGTGLKTSKLIIE